MEPHPSGSWFPWTPSKLATPAPKIGCHCKGSYCSTLRSELLPMVYTQPQPLYQPLELLSKDLQKHGTLKAPGAPPSQHYLSHFVPIPCWDSIALEIETHKHKNTIIYFLHASPCWTNYSATFPNISVQEYTLLLGFMDCSEVLGSPEVWGSQCLPRPLHRLSWLPESYGSCSNWARAGDFLLCVFQRNCVYLFYVGHIKFF